MLPFAPGIVLAATLLLAAPHLAAQTLEIVCEGSLRAETEAAGSPCTQTISRIDSLPSHHVVVRITRNGQNVRDAAVRFSTLVGKVHPETATTGTDGVAKTMWFGPQGTSRAGIAVAVDAQGMSALRYVQLGFKPATEMNRPRLALEPFNGADQSWFENASLRKPVVYRIMINTEKEGDNDQPILQDLEADSICSAQRVVFRPYTGSGSATPDTSFGQVYPYRLATRDEGTGCFVHSAWALGPGVGDRQMRVTLLPGAGYRSPDPPASAEAVSRALPRIIGGIAYMRSRSYDGIEGGGKRTARIERVRPDGSTITIDTTVTDSEAFKEFEGEWQPTAIVGLNTSVPLNGRGWMAASRRVSLTAGVDLYDLLNHWFAGTSLFRIASPRTESFPIDLHVLGHWRRNEIVDDPQACRQGGSCDTSKHVRFQGVAFVLSADASTLISEVIKKLAPT